MKVVTGRPMEEKLTKFCRDIAIKEVEACITVLGIPKVPEEMNGKNDPRLGEELRHILGQINPNTPLLQGWRRIVNSTRDGKPGPIIIELENKEIREALIQTAKNTKWKLKRTIPNILMEDFKELSKLADDIGMKDGSRCFVG